METKEFSMIRVCMSKKQYNTYILERDRLLMAFYATEKGKESDPNSVRFFDYVADHNIFADDEIEVY